MIITQTETTITISKEEYQKLQIAKHMYDSFLSSEGLYPMNKVAQIIGFPGGKIKLMEQ